MSEMQSLETQNGDLLESLASERIELDRYKTLLENEKGKVLELQQLHKAEDKSELEQLVEHTRSVCLSTVHSSAVCSSTVRSAQTAVVLLLFVLYSGLLHVFVYYYDNCLDPCALTISYQAHGLPPSPTLLAYLMRPLLHV